MLRIIKLNLTHCLYLEIVNFLIDFIKTNKFILVEEFSFIFMRKIYINSIINYNIYQSRQYYNR